MYDKNDRYKYGKDKYKYEQRSRYRTPTRTARAQLSPAAIFFLVLIIAAIAVGFLFLGMFINSESSKNVDTIVKKEVLQDNIVKLSSEANKASNSSVVISTDDGSKGSGFVYNYSENGVEQDVVITCYHVLANAKSVHIRFNDKTVIQSTDFDGDEASDVAVIKVDGLKDKKIVTKIRDFKKKPLKATEDIAVIGASSLSLPGSILEAKITTSRQEKVYNRKFRNFSRSLVELKTNRSIKLDKGLSGSGIIDVDGNLVGILHGGNDVNSDVGYIMPIDDVRKVVNDFCGKGYVSNRADYNFIRLMEFELPSAQYSKAGLYIEKINSEKYFALDVGDYIVSLDGQEIKTISDWIEYIKSKEIGASIKLVVEKEDTSRQTVQIIVEQKQSGDIK